VRAPEGECTLLLCDVGNSDELFSRLPLAMMQALRLFKKVIADRIGVVRLTQSHLIGCRTAVRCVARVSGRC
jgi:hypothetical protein